MSLFIVQVVVGRYSCSTCRPQRPSLTTDFRSIHFFYTFLVFTFLERASRTKEKEQRSLKLKLSFFPYRSTFFLILPAWVSVSAKIVFSA